MPITKTKMVTSIWVILLTLSLPVLANEEVSLSCSEIPFCSAPPKYWNLYSQPLSTPYGTFISSFYYGRGQFEGVSVNQISYHYLSYCIRVICFGENYDTVHSERKLYRIDASFGELKNLEKLEKSIKTKFGAPELSRSHKYEYITFKWNINNIILVLKFDTKKNAGLLSCKYMPLSNILKKEKSIIDSEIYGSEDLINKILELTRQYQEACVESKIRG